MPIHRDARGIAEVFQIRLEDHVYTGRSHPYIYCHLQLLKECAVDTTE